MSFTAVFWLLIVAGYQVAIVFAPHPEQIQRPWLRLLVAVLGRLSVLRHRTGPGTLHPPLTRQPWWSPAELERLIRTASQVRGEMQPLPDAETGPVRRSAPMVSWLQPPAAALLLVLTLAGGCASISKAKRVAAQGLASDRALVQEVTAYSVRTERDITLTSRTQEEAERRGKDVRGAIDLALKVLERAAQNLKDVAKALGVSDAAGGTP